MGSSTETTGNAASSKTVSTTPSRGSTISAATYQEMLAVLQDLLDHSHTTNDNYTSVCQCNCNCACNRGIL